MDAKMAQNRETNIVSRELEDIDQTIDQVKYIREHLVELTAGMNHTRVYRNQINGKYHYFVNESPRVVLNPREAADTVFVEPVEDLLAELRMLEAKKARVIAKLDTISAEMRAKRDTAELQEKQVREHQDKDKQSHENEAKNLRDTIAEAERTGSTKIFSLRGKYSLENPTRVATNGDVSDSLFVQEVSLDRARQRLDEIGVPPSKTEVLRRLDSAIDSLAPTPKEGAEAPNMATREFRENLRKVLVNVRLGVSDFPQLSASEFFDPVSEARAIQRLTRLADTNIEAIDPATMVTAVGDLVNVSRYGISDSVAVLLGTVRGLTSGRLYRLGEAPETDGLQKQRATLAGGIDGVLDYSQAFVDTIVVPDKIAHNAWDISTLVMGDNQEFFSNLKTIIGDNIKNPIDQDYCVAYIAAVIASMCAMPNPLTVASLPAIILKALARVAQKVGVAIDTLSMSQITKLVASTHLDSTIAKYTAKGASGAEKVVAEGSDKTDTASTGVSRLRDLSEEARLARVQTLLKSITDTAILTNIFGDKIRTGMGA